VYPRLLTKTNMIAIIAGFVSSFLWCNWAAGTLHDHTQDLNEQYRILAGACSPIEEGELPA